MSGPPVPDLLPSCVAAACSIELHLGNIEGLPAEYKKARVEVERNGKKFRSDIATSKQGAGGRRTFCWGKPIGWAATLKAPGSAPQLTGKNGSSAYKRKVGAELLRYVAAPGLHGWPAVHKSLRLSSCRYG